VSSSWRMAQVPKEKMNQLGAPCLDFQTWDFASEPIVHRVTQRLKINAAVRHYAGQSHRIASASSQPVPEFPSTQIRASAAASSRLSLVATVHAKSSVRATISGHAHTPKRPSRLCETPRRFNPNPLRGIMVKRRTIEVPSCNRLPQSLKSNPILYLHRNWKINTPSPPGSCSRVSVSAHLQGIERNIWSKGGFLREACCDNIDSAWARLKALPTQNPPWSKS